MDALDNWGSWDHKTIKGMSNKLDSGQMHGLSRGWSTVGGKITSDAAGYQHAMQQAIGAKWEGAAAQSAQQSATAYSQQGQEFGHAVELTGTKSVRRRRVRSRRGRWFRRRKTSRSVRPQLLGC